MDTNQAAGSEASHSRPTSTPPNFEERFDEIVGQTLEIAAAAGAGLFVFFALLHPFLYDPPASYALVALALATAAVSATLWWLARERRLSARLTQPAILVGLGVVLLHTFGLASLRPTPEMTAWFGLVVLAGGVLLLSWHWFVALVAASVATWGLVFVAAPTDPGWLLEAALVLVTSVVIGAVTLASRRRVYGNLLEREETLRRVNEQLDASRRRAERAERLQARFVANVSHDVRTPITAIIGEVRELEEELEGAQEERLETIEASARHLLRLIDDLLDISRAQAGELSLRRESIELEELLHQCIQMVAHRAEDKRLELTSDIDEDVPDFVEADPHRLQQVLGNLLTNAVKFTPEGSIELRACVASTEPFCLRFEVEDTGIGIPEDRLGDLFRPFSRIEALPDAEGTGLGLAISKLLVDLQAGEIGVETEEGEGSTFWFTLPASPAEPREAETSRGSGRLAGRTAWLVGSKGALSSSLKRWGVYVETMRGIGVVEGALVEGRRPDFLVLDLLTIQAPESFLAERVRAWRSQGIPVLVAKAADGELDELDEVPGPGTILAPSDPEDELRQAVLQSLEEAGQPSAPVQAPDPALGDEHPLRILVVEDSAVLRRVLRSMLGGLGYDAEDVPSGEEALDRVETGDYDLVFLDLGLPGMSGQELARRIQEEADQPPRIVALTGSIDEASIEEARTAGVDAYLVKPAALEDIREQLELAAARGRDDAEDPGAEEAPEGEEEGAEDDAEGPAPD